MKNLKLTTMIKKDAAFSNKRRSQPLTAYNIFFMLERHLIVREKERFSGVAAANEKHQLPYDLGGYESLSLPELPSRFRSLILPQGWYVPGRNIKRQRKHVKTHGGELLIPLFFN
jgi:hypothetical protein